MARFGPKDSKCMTLLLIPSRDFMQHCQKPSVQKAKQAVDCRTQPPRRSLALVLGQNLNVSRLGFGGELSEFPLCPVQIDHGLLEALIEPYMGHRPRRGAGVGGAFSKQLVSRQHQTASKDHQPLVWRETVNPSAQVPGKNPPFPGPPHFMNCLLPAAVPDWRRSKTPPRLQHAPRPVGVKAPALLSSPAERPPIPKEHERPSWSPQRHALCDSFRRKQVEITAPRMPLVPLLPLRPSHHRPSKLRGPLT